MTFSEKLVRLRKIRGLTQDELASAVGVSRQAVYKWECGQSYPEVSKLLEIKILFGISIDDLLDDSYEIPLPEKKKRKRSIKARDVAPEAKSVHAPIDAANIPVTIPDFSESRPVYSEPEEPAAVEKTEPEQESTYAEHSHGSVSEEKPAEVPAEEPAEVPAEEPAEEPAEVPAREPDVSTPAAEAKTEKAEEHTEKERGFFGRLFGRR